MSKNTVEEEEGTNEEENGTNQKKIFGEISSTMSVTAARTKKTHDDSLFFILVADETSHFEMSGLHVCSPLKSDCMEVTRETSQSIIEPYVLSMEVRVDVLHHWLTAVFRALLASKTCWADANSAVIRPTKVVDASKRKGWKSTGKELFPRLFVSLIFVNFFDI